MVQLRIDIIHGLLCEDLNLLPVDHEHAVLGLDIAGKHSMRGIVLEHVDHVVEVDEGVIDADHVHALLQTGPQDNAPDPAETERTNPPLLNIPYSLSLKSGRKKWFDLITAEKKYENRFFSCSHPLMPTLAAPGLELGADTGLLFGIMMAVNVAQFGQGIFSRQETRRLSILELIIVPRMHRVHDNNWPFNCLVGW